MRSIAILLAIAGLFGATVSPLWGQADGGATPGDNAPRRRTLGQPLAPQPGSVNGGLQRGPSGEFRGRAGNSVGSATPGRSSDGNAAAASGGPPGMFGDRRLGQPLAPKAGTAFDGLGRGASGEFLGSNGTLSRFPPLGAWIGADTPSPALLPVRTLPPPGPDGQRRQVEVFSADMSAHLTRLARSGGVRTSTGVLVYLCGDGVVLQGTVDSLQQSDLIASLILLAPGVWSVDNRLTIAVQPASFDGLPPGRAVEAGDAVRPMRDLPAKAK